MISRSEEDSHIHPHFKQNEEKGDIPRQKIMVGVSCVTFQVLLVTHRGCREHKHQSHVPKSSRAGWGLGSAPKQLGHLPSSRTERRKMRVPTTELLLESKSKVCGCLSLTLKDSLMLLFYCVCLLKLRGLTTSLLIWSRE